MIYSDVYAISDHDFTTAPIFGERRASAIRSGFAAFGPIPDYMTTTRAQLSSSATYFDVSGRLCEARADEARINGNALIGRNLFQNPRGEGGSVGVLGSGGAWPTGWGTGAVFSGLQTEIIATGVDRGMEYIRVRLYGTSDGGGGRSTSSYSAPALPGVAVTSSVFSRLISGSVAGLALQVEVREYAGGSPSTGISSSNLSMASSWGRAAATRVMADPTTTSGRYTLRISGATSVAYDVVFDLAWPQIEVSAFATEPSLPPVGTQRASVRYGTSPGRLLVEPQRTNLVPNPRTPFGTGWTNTAGAFASVEPITGPDGVVGSAFRVTESTADLQRLSYAASFAFTAGVSYTFSGIFRAGTCGVVQLNTSSAVFGATTYINFDLQNGVVGTVGSNVSSYQMRALGDGWYWCSMTAPALSTYSGISHGINMVTSATSARSSGYQGTNRTLDVFWVWTEQGHVAMTPALPPVGAPGSATVGGDNITIPYTALETDGNRGGTHILNVVIPVPASAAAQTLLSLNDGTSNNKIEVYNPVGTSALMLACTKAGSTVETSLGTFTAGSTTRLALVVNGLGRAAGSVNNGAVQAITGAPSLFDLTTVRLGSSLSGANPMRLELVDWAHVPFVYSDDTTARL